MLLVANMHHAKLALAVSPALIAFAAAKYRDQSWGTAFVVNSCGDNVYWQTDIQSDKVFSTIQPQQTATVPMYNLASDSSNCLNPGGGSVKLAPKKMDGTMPDFYATIADPSLQLEFVLGTCPNGVKDLMDWVDLSNVNAGDGKNIKRNQMDGNGQVVSGGPPFYHGGINLHVPKDPDADRGCVADDYNCTGVYLTSGDNTKMKKDTSDKNDIYLTLCSDHHGMVMGPGGSGAPGGNNNPPASPVAGSSNQQPAQTSAPPVVHGQKDAAVVAPSPTPAATSEDVVWVTEKIQTTVILQQRDLEGVIGEPAKEKRHDHIHEHVHQKINKRRHGA